VTDEAELATLNRRLSELEQDVEGERAVSRHSLRKLGDVENVLIDLTKAVADLTEAVSRIESQTAYQIQISRRLFANLLNLIHSRPPSNCK